MMRRALLTLSLAALALLAALQAGGAMAQTPDPEGPVLVYQNIKDGDVLDQPPLSIQLCFAEPINIKDLDKGGDFAFTVRGPDGIGLGHRDIFQPDGYGIAIQPGNPVGDVEGEWTVTYRVTTPDAQHATEGTIKYTVDPNGEPAPRVSPPACVASGGTATASPVPSGPTPTGTVVLSVSASPSPRPGTATLQPASPTPAETRGPEAEDDGSDPDILKWALITVGITGGLALLTLIGYFVRRAVGYEPHKPRDGDDGGHH